MNKIIFILIFLYGFFGLSQENTENILTFEEYLGYVKKYHPIVKQARLISSEAESKLMKARGAFDPKIEIDYNKKQFKNTEYFNKLNSAFKIPTWYGVELKANYETNKGIYLNPENNVPEDGLYSVGVSLSLARGLLTNKRMAALKQAKLYTQVSAAKQQLLINDILYDAINTYFIWLKNYQIYQVYKNYIKNGEERLDNITKSYKLGEKTAIDTLEATVSLNGRVLEMEKARIKYVKATLEVSNYIWLDNNLPLELKDNIMPDISTIFRIDGVLKNSFLNINDSLLNVHPKIKALQLQKEMLTIDKRLKMNNLLPIIDFQYNFLTTDRNSLNSFNTLNYKSGLYINVPLFLRKERGNLKLAKVKLQDKNFELTFSKINLKNKIKVAQEQIHSYLNQYKIVNNLVADYQQLVKAEERKFLLGEGSFFLINYREAKLIETEIKKFEINYNLLNSKFKLFQQLNFLSS